MAKYSITKAKINEKITTNTTQAITGNVLNEVLQTMVESLGADYQFGGLVQPGSAFTAGEQPVVFLATTPGTYTNFGGIVVADGEVALLVWSGTAWSKQTPDISTRTEVNQLGQEIVEIISRINDFRRYTQESGFFICDVNGNIVIQYDENGFDVAKVSQHTKDKIKEIVGDISGGRETNEEGLYFIDTNFNIFMQYTGDGFDVAKLSSEFINKLSLKPNDKYVYVAAHDSSSYDKKKADYVCTGEHDEIVINAAIASLTRGGTVQLLDGNYFIDGFNSEGNSAIYFGNTNYAKVVNIKGTTENKSYNTRFGAVIHVTQAAIESMNNNDTYRVFYGTSAKPGGGGDFGTYTWMNNVNFENFYLMIYDASKKWIGIDGRHFGNMYIKQVGVYTEQYFNDRFLHRKPATPINGSMGVYSVGSSNDEMARCGYDTLDVGGMYYGIVCEGVDHLIMKTCSAARCVVGYKFIGAMAKTLTMLNCCDEGNYRLPEFSSTGHLTCIDFNIERFNADYIPDDITENIEHQATESNIGGWHGFISYTLQGGAYGISSLFKNGEGVNFKIINLNTPASSWFNN